VALRRDFSSCSRLSPLRGRGQDRARLLSAVSNPTSRLVTVTGPVGVGKSRLVAEELSDGAAWISETDLLVSGRLETILAKAAGASRAADGSPSSAPILVLDNLIGVDNGRVIVDLVDRFDHARFVVSTSQRLNVRGEVVVQVEPLAVPERVADVLAGTWPAVECFADYAQRSMTDFEVDSSNAEAIRHILMAAGGLPLAIELLAGWLRVLTVHDLAERCGDSLDLLVGGPADLPAHQRDLRATVSASIERLDPGAQQVLLAAAQFGGPARLEWIEQVLGRRLIPHELGSAVDASLATSAPADGQLRVGVPSVVRTFLRESGRGSDFAGRHADWLEGFTMESAARIGTSDTWQVCRDLEREIETSGGGLQLFRAEPRRLAALALELVGYWRFLGRFEEAAHWLEAARSAVDADDPLTPWLTLASARALRDLNQYEAALALATHLWSDTSLHSSVRIAAAVELAHLQRVSHFLAGSSELIERASALLAAFDDPPLIDAVTPAVRRWIGGLPGAIHSARGDRLCVDGDPTGARAEFQAALDAAVAIGDTIEQVWAHLDLAMTARLLCQPRDEKESLRTGLQTARGLGPQSVELAYSLIALAQFLTIQGDARAAAPLAIEAVEVLDRQGRPLDIAQGKRLAALICAEAGDGARARRLFSESFAVSRALTHRAQLANLLGALAVAAPSVGASACDRARWLGAAEAEFPPVLALAAGPWRRRADKLRVLRKPPAVPFDEAIATARSHLSRDDGDCSVAAGFGLSPRESEILVALTESLTDREIADRLFIGVRTVNTHVAAVLRKLGVSNRREAARWAVDHLPRRTVG
jgi:DNA-binding CsgD family transcriptional regulator/tetratricopeptide (TPR) repeat protein